MTFIYEIMSWYHFAMFEGFHYFANVQWIHQRTDFVLHICLITIICFPWTSCFPCANKHNFKITTIHLIKIGNI